MGSYQRPPYSTQLYVKQGLALVPQIVGPPSGTVWVVKEITLYCGAATGSIFYMYEILHSAVQVYNVQNTYGYAQWTGQNLVYPDTGGFGVFCTLNTVDISINGYQLTVPP
jgi:hypothetical protein